MFYVLLYVTLYPFLFCNRLYGEERAVYFTQFVFVLYRDSCVALGNGIPSFQPFTNSDQYSFQIRLSQMDISAFSGQNEVTKMCPKSLLTSYYK